MYLCKHTAKNGNTIYYVQKKFRDENGKSTSKNIETLGSYDELKKLHDDPDAWAKEYIASLNKAEKEASRSIKVSYSPSKQINIDEKNSFDGGYLFLQKIYYELGLNKICKKISKKYKFEYDLNDILSKLIYGRILFPGSKASTFEDSRRLLEGPEFEQHDIYRALEVLNNENDLIQSELYKNSKDVISRNDSILYYDCTNFFFEI